MKRHLLIACLVLQGLAMPFVQAEPGKDPDKTCYYINLNQAESDQIISLPSFDLCLKYFDHFAQVSHLPVLLRNWKLDTLNFQLLVKEYGNNYYSFDLRSLGANKENEVYSLVYKNESGNTYHINFKVSPAEKADIALYIESDPISSNCGKPEGNLIEFKGIIDGGKAPYIVTWQVLDEGNEKPLYHERTDSVNSQGYTPTIQVSIAPAYKVSLKVTDACQAENKQVLTVSCDDDFVHPNSIFIEPQDKTDNLSKPSIEKP